MSPQEALPGLEPPQPAEPLSDQEVLDRAARIAEQSVNHAQPADRVSEPYADLGGQRHHELSLDEAKAQQAADTGGQQAARLVARGSAADYFQTEFNISGAPLLTDEQLQTNEQGIQATAHVLAPHEEDRLRGQSNGDKTWMVAAKIANAEKREQRRHSRS